MATQAGMAYDKVKAVEKTVQKIDLAFSAFSMLLCRTK
jgi:hypothetical protein